ncbi:MAG: FTR1 family iron permease [Candidatus Nitronauta litoralis]|uniref:FTR1 family iron permease n=1 Tax=Candidatus Nitronauta litoralis TaxID=2705533 RepID=A0A7T0BZK2_9BACT|nr:MAG: FTR1 family iron permease [Candidatus Nitronauta litoralis]
MLGLFILLASIPAKADQPEPGKNYRIVVEKIIKSGDALMENYSPQNSAVTGNGYSRLYFDVFESSGMEFNLGLQDDSLKQKIEFSFSQMINLSMNGEDPQVIRSTWDQLKEDLDLAVKRYAADDEPKGFWGLALQSFLILTREGMEAILVVAALVAYLRRSGNGEKVPVIWKGVGLALAASVATAWAFNSLIEVSGKNRESLEGFTLLLAAAMLLYVSYWLYSKSGSDRWQVFIKGQMDKALSGGSLFALGAVSFLAVYREGAETILFYQALVSGTTSDLNAIWVGVGLAALTLAVIYYFVRVASIRLPISLFFSFTAFLLFLMALVFTGQGLLELQISGLVSSTPLTGWPQVDSLGLYPTLETLSGQLVMLGLFVAGLCWMKVNKKSSIALMKKLLANESK